jgi:N-acetyl-gamma-glutamyl-phosphate reductase
MSKIKIGILGATAYTGIELIQILSRHNQAEIAFVSSRSNAGDLISTIFPRIKGILDATLISPEEAQGREADCIFSCLPHAVSAGLCLPFIQKGIKVIDLSADFRLNDADNYKQWYNHDHPASQLLSQAVFGLPEHYREQIKTTKILANPGCYPTSILLPLLPLLKEKATKISMIIADSKSGVSGAGRTLKLNSHFVEANENLSAYSVGHSHRHVAEIEQELSKAAGQEMKMTFSPHLIPLTRGILSTIYIATNRSAAECREIATNAYRNEPFVRVRSPKDLPMIANVANTNYCDLTFTDGENGRPVIAVSTIDNLLKGAAGQAVQNMNIMFGIEETTGLR